MPNNRKRNRRHGKAGQRQNSSLSKKERNALAETVTAKFKNLVQQEIKAHTQVPASPRNGPQNQAANERQNRLQPSSNISWTAPEVMLQVTKGAQAPDPAKWFRLRDAHAAMREVDLQQSAEVRGWWVPHTPKQETLWTREFNAVVPVQMRQAWAASPSATGPG